MPKSARFRSSDRSGCLAPALALSSCKSSSSRRRRLRQKRDSGGSFFRLASRRRYVGLAQLSGDGSERRLRGADVRGGGATHLLAGACTVKGGEMGDLKAVSSSTRGGGWAPSGQAWWATWWVKRSGAGGGSGGGWPEHPRRWLGAQWAGLFLVVPSCPSRQVRPEEVQEPSWGAAKGAL